MFNSHVHNNEGCFGKHTHINIFGECVSESVQDRENEIHVKDGGWWIAFLHFALSADLYELASFILTPLAGNWSKKWGGKKAEKLWCPDRKEEDGRWSNLSKEQSYEPVFFHFAVEREREWVRVRAQGLKREKSATVAKNNSVCRLCVYMCLWYVFNQSQSRLLLF